ncbi:alpha amylase C-terminal domain-containing protein [Halolactibacillus sp. JCM 19043]|nr:alpha amylase C-terminal domain-containing protein [Halolactibacillus sp. JCM 19043]
MHYGYSENFILPFSHDEVVHGKKALIDKPVGDYEDKFKTLKLLMLYQMTHPGKKLNFMGNEIGQFIEWRYYEPVEWFLLDYEKHEDHRQFNGLLNRLYMQEKSLYEQDHDPAGFKWMDADNRDQSIYIYERKSTDESVTIVLNFTPVEYNDFRVGVETPGEYRVMFTTKEAPYRIKRYSYIKTEEIPMHGQDQSILLPIGALEGLVIKKKKAARKKK